MIPHVAITWDYRGNNRCPHNTVSFLEDDRVEETVIETEVVPFNETPSHKPVSQVQSLKKYVRVQCADCATYGTMYVKSS